MALFIFLGIFFIDLRLIIKDRELFSNYLFNKQKKSVGLTYSMQIFYYFLFLKDLNLLFIMNYKII